MLRLSLDAKARVNIGLFDMLLYTNITLLETLNCTLQLTLIKIDDNTLLHVLTKDMRRVND